MPSYELTHLNGPSYRAPCQLSKRHWRGRTCLSRTKAKGGEEVTGRDKREEEELKKWRKSILLPSNSALANVHLLPSIQNMGQDYNELVQGSMYLDVNRFLH